MLFRNLHLKNFELRRQIWNKDGEAVCMKKKLEL